MASYPTFNAEADLDLAVGRIVFQTMTLRIGCCLITVTAKQTTLLNLCFAATTQSLSVDALNSSGLVYSLVLQYSADYV